MSANKSSAGGAPSKDKEGKVEEKAGAEKKSKGEEKKSVLELLEEDDEFEEFEGGNLDLDAKDAEEGQLWQDDWDESDLNDEFTNQYLRVQLKEHLAEVGGSSGEGK